MASLCLRVSDIVIGRVFAIIVAFSSFLLQHTCRRGNFVFLALLDYVSTTHEIAICPSSVRRPSSVRVAFISQPNARISFKFWLLLPLGHTLGLF